jgi:hypothetical protein
MSAAIVTVIRDHKEYQVCLRDGEPRYVILKYWPLRAYCYATRMVWDVSFEKMGRTVQAVVKQAQEIQNARKQ